MAKTVADIKVDFDNTYGNISTSLGNLGSKNHQGDNYWMLRIIETNLPAFQATGDITYLERIMVVMDSRIDAGVIDSTLPNAANAGYHYSPRTTTNMNALTNVATNSLIVNTTTNTDWKYNGTIWVDQTTLSGFSPIEEEATPDYFSTGHKALDNHSDREFTQGYTNGGEYSLFDMHGYRDLAKLLYILYLYPSIRATSNVRTTYQDDYDKLLAFVETDLFGKWETRGVESYLMRSTVHISSHAANMSFYLYKITGKAKYLDFYNDWNTTPSNDHNSTYLVSYEDQLRARDYTLDDLSVVPGYAWASTWENMVGESDIDHQNAEMRTVVNQLMFSDSMWETHKQKFINTSHWVIDQDPTVPDKLDGTGAVDNSYDLGWAAWGRFDSTLQDKYEISSVYTGGEGNYRELVLQGTLIYNRAYLSNTLVYPEFLSSSASIKQREIVNLLLSE